MGGETGREKEERQGGETAAAAARHVIGTQGGRTEQFKEDRRVVPLVVVVI